MLPPRLSPFAFPAAVYPAFQPFPVLPTSLRFREATAPIAPPMIPGEPWGFPPAPTAVGAKASGECYDTFCDPEALRTVALKTAVENRASAWYDHHDRKLWLLRGKPLAPISRMELQCKLGYTVAITPEVENQLRTLTEFNLRDFVPRKLHGTKAGEAVKISDRFAIFTESLVGMLMLGISMRSPDPVDAFCYYRVATLESNLRAVGSHLRDLEQTHADLFTTDRSVHAVYEAVNNDIRKWAEELTCFSCDVWVQSQVPPLRVTDVPEPPMPTFRGIHILTRHDCLLLRLTMWEDNQGTTEDVPFTSRTRKRRAKHADRTPTNVRRRVSRICRAWMAGNCT